MFQKYYNKFLPLMDDVEGRFLFKPWERGWILVVKDAPIKLAFKLAVREA